MSSINNIKGLLRKRPYLFALAITLLVLCFNYLVFGWFYEEGTDPYFKIISAGYYMDAPQPYFNMGIHTGLSYGYAWLYTNYPGVAWYDGIMLLFTTLMGMLGFRVLLLLNQRLQLPKWLRLILLLVLGGLLVESISLIQLTRVSFIMAGCGLLLLFDAYINNDLINPKMMFKTILLNGTILLALLVRIEPPVLLLLFLALAFILYRGFSKHTFKEIFKTALPALILVLLVGFWLRFPHVPADDFYNKIRPYTYTLWDYGVDDAGLSLQSKKDTAFIYAALNHFIADANVFTPQAFDAIGLQPVDKSPEYWPAYLSRAWLKLNPAQIGQVGFQWDYLLLLAAALLLGMAHALLSGHWKAHVLFWLSLIAIWVFMKMEYRIMQPYMLVYLMSCWLLKPIAAPKFEKYKLTAVLMIALTLLIGIGQVYATIDKLKQHHIMHQYLTTVMGQVEKEFQTQTILPGLGIMEKFENNLFNQPTPLDYVRYASVDNGLLYLYESQHTKMQRLTGEDDFVQIINDIAGKPEAFVWVGMASRFEVLETIFKDLYGLNLETVDVSSKILAIGFESYPPIELKVVQFKRVEQ